VRSPPRFQRPLLIFQGAGPSGLVSAKTLVHDHPNDTFHVTVFEQSQRIGGLWPISKVDDGIVNPDMCTNQSRHTVSFSDLAWPESAPAFPKAWQVGEYLQRYIKTYPGYEIRTNCQVLKTESRSGRWKVQVQDGTSTSPETLDFDHMIVATGFFGKPKLPQILKDLPVPVMHSSELRDVRDLLTKNGKTHVGTRRNIVVVGGQMSGVETAASIAFQLSSDFASLGEDVIPDAQQYSVCQVVQEPFWVMPLFFPKDPVVDVPGQHDQKVLHFYLMNYTLS
jgi:cation diffusion facilitator CzcD-associated flavoprotein CzcO